MIRQVFFTLSCFAWTVLTATSVQAVPAIWAEEAEAAPDSNRWGRHLTQSGDEKSDGFLQTLITVKPW
ncbi:MAG: hypothetical protein O3C60_03165 [Planctomycetota bacterium]|nr:hypothetical protein [Planctomycetota bacterium]